VSPVCRAVAWSSCARRVGTLLDAGSARRLAMCSPRDGFRDWSAERPSTSRSAIGGYVRARLQLASDRIGRRHVASTTPPPGNPLNDADVVLFPSERRRTTAAYGCSASTGCRAGRRAVVIAVFVGFRASRPASRRRPSSASPELRGRPERVFLTPDRRTADSRTAVGDGLVLRSDEPRRPSSARRGGAVPGFTDPELELPSRKGSCRRSRGGDGVSGTSPVPGSSSRSAASSTDDPSGAPSSDGASAGCRRPWGMRAASDAASDRSRCAVGLKSKIPRSRRPPRRTSRDGRDVLALVRPRVRTARPSHRRCRSDRRRRLRRDVDPSAARRRLACATAAASVRRPPDAARAPHGTRDVAHTADAVPTLRLVRRERGSSSCTFVSSAYRTADGDVPPDTCAAALRPESDPRAVGRTGSRAIIRSLRSSGCRSFTVDAFKSGGTVEDLAPRPLCARGGRASPRSDRSRLRPLSWTMTRRRRERPATSARRRHVHPEGLRGPPRSRASRTRSTWKMNSCLRAGLQLRRPAGRRS